MSKVAIVVQRCHESIVGGSETLAWQYAELLGEAFDVDILTTTPVSTRASVFRSSKPWPCECRLWLTESPRYRARYRRDSVSHNRHSHGHGFDERNTEALVLTGVVVRISTSNASPSNSAYCQARVSEPPTMLS